MAEIAETYLHLKSFLTPADARALGDRVFSETISSAASIYDFPVEIEVRIDEGSLKTWLNVTCALVNIVSAYGSLRQGIDQVFDDAKFMGDSYIGIFVNETKPTPKQLYRTERRTKTAGKLVRIYNRVDWLEAHKNDISKKSYEDAVQELGRYILKLQMTLNPTDAAIVEDSLNKYRTVQPYIDARPTVTQASVFQDLLFSPEIPTELRGGHTLFLKRGSIEKETRAIDPPGIDDDETEQ